MKIAIKARFSGVVLFTAEIETTSGETSGECLGKAVRAAVAAKANLSEANLSEANLSEADLRWTDLSGADLSGANLRWTDLSGANLSRAILSGANLSEANLSEANLRWTDLSGAGLCEANLSGVDMYGANLSAVRSIKGTAGLNKWIKCLQVEEWPITYTSDHMQIGCQKHSLDAWQSFTDAEIRMMDGTRALNFWRKWKGWIFQTIEMAPAEPTKAP